ncbi:MAG: DUF2953 domain-containing protein [Methanomicrobiales archaeon]|nr:DUF2953 domain-containing protein [Methanomicrobiales archaeon]
MIHPTGVILIPVGFIVLYSLIFWYIYRTPLVLSGLLSRDSANLFGDVTVRYSLMSVRIRIGRPIEGTIRISTKQVYSFPISLSESPDESKEGNIKDEKKSLSEITGYISPIFRYINKIIDHIHIDSLFCHAVLGCGDPFTTGLVYGYIQAIIPIFNRKYGDISIIPDFINPRLEGNIGLNVLITSPIALIIFAGRIFFPVFFYYKFRVK